VELKGLVYLTIHIIVDIAKCVGCFNCMVACKDEHVGNCWLPYTDEQDKHVQKWIGPEKHERGAAPFTEMFFVTKLCQHCGDAPCEKAAPGAVMRREDGVVLLDAEKARGNRGLVDACPYGSISWSEERHAAQKCTLCAHLLDDGWREPRCVQACPLRALSIVRCSDGEFEAMAKEQQLEPLADGANAPRVVYRNLYKRDTRFIAGVLAYRDSGIERAAADATVRLMKGGETAAEEKADFFGEFKIGRIPKNSGTYELVCSLEGYGDISREVVVGEECPCLDVMVFA
jgi:Fe-S-cluster-containing dehydrogenase component